MENSPSLLMLLQLILLFVFNGRYNASFLLNAVFVGRFLSDGKRNKISTLWTCFFH